MTKKEEQMIANMNGHTGQIVAAIVAVVIIVCATFLGYEKVFDGTALMSLFTAIGGFALGSYGASSNTKKVLDSVGQAGGGRATDPPANGIH